MKNTNRRYTKGDCYAICEFLECLLRDCNYVITDICSALDYPDKPIKELLQRLAGDINDTICDEQDEQDYTEQMAEIMEITHIKGENK